MYRYNDLPYYYKMQFDFLTTSSSFNFNAFDNNWVSDNVNTYLTLQKDCSPDSLTREVGYYITANHKEAGDDFCIKPLAMLNVYEDVRKGTNTGSSSLYLYIFSVVAILILCIACLNYSNLAIAGFRNRSKEIGIRKVYGALKGNIFFQYISEALVLAFLSMFLSLLWVKIFLPFFNNIIGKNIELTLSMIYDMLPEMVILTFITGIISGIYPAWYVSSLPPVKILSGVLRSGAGSDMFRKLFLYLQCSISISIVIISFFVNYQLDYIRDRREGYEEHYWVKFPEYHGFRYRYEDFTADLRQNKNIFNVLNKEEFSKEESLFSSVSKKDEYSDDLRYIYVKIKPIDLPNTISHLENVWNKYCTENDFSYSFIDKEMQEEFSSEARMAKFFYILTLLVVILTSFGFFAMSAYISSQRSKEIAIRKTLGAGTISIYILILKEFLFVLFFAILTAYFTGLVMSTNWVYKFTARINISYEPFLYAGIFSILLLVISVSYNAIKAALTNPAEILRYE